MYVILTSKPGQFRTEASPGLAPIETYDYLFYGRQRARFVIAQLLGEGRVKIVDEAEPPTVNLVPTKFLEKFDTLERARQELKHLCSFGDMDTQLVRADAPPAAPEPKSKAEQVRITFLSNDGKVLEAPGDSNLLRVSLRGQGGIPFKCGGGVCGTCKCRIEQGREHTDEVKAKERRHLDDAQLAQGYRMACQTFVRGDIAVSW